MSYAKGYRGERELVYMLSKKGYVVMRAPRSGRIGLAAPDVVAVKNGNVLAIECKNRKKAFKVEQEQLKELKEWEEKGGAKCFVAWKRFYNGWTFFYLKDVINNNGNIGKRFANMKGLEFEDIL